MQNSEHISITLNQPEHITGSLEYSINVEITNISGKPINDLRVYNTLSVGKIALFEEDIGSNTLTELEDKKRRLIHELEKAIESAYAKNRRNKMNFIEQVAFTIIEASDLYAALFSKRKSELTTPYWAEEALKIDEWDDVVKLENEIINLEPEDSFLRKAYALNKNKLSRVLGKLKEQEKVDSFSKGVTLLEGSTISFPFKFQAPHCLNRKVLDTSFKTAYKIDESQLVHTRSQSKKLTIHPSAFSVPTGGMVGAAIGYCIKFAMTQDAAKSFSFATLAGCIGLGLVVSLLTSRKPEANKSISVEDLTGGLIIGVLSGLYSQQILEKLQNLL